MIYDYLIVGQGIAGSFMAIQCMLQNKSYQIMNAHDPAWSSKMAAGLFSPVSGSRLAAAWNLNSLQTELDHLCSFLETISQEKVIHYTHIKHCFTSVKEANDYSIRFDRPEIKPHISQDNGVEDITIQDYGAFTVKNGGWVNTEKLLQQVRLISEKQQNYLDSEFDLNNFTNENNLYILNNTFYRNIIFCEGRHILKNKLFQNLPFAFCKGEVLDVEIKDLNTDYILKKGVFILKYPNGEYRLGSTYEWNKNDVELNEKNKQDLERKLKNLIPFEFKTINHRASVRPAFRDRFPIIGHLTDTPDNFYVINGLGSKGIMYAPYLSKLLFNHIEYKEAIPKEVDINRFMKN